MTDAEFKRLEKQAYADNISLDKLPAPEYRYFDRIRRLYKVYRDGYFSLEYAQQQKNIALSEYNRDIEEAERVRNIYAENQLRRKLVNSIKIQINKSEDVGEIARLACEVIGLLTDDSVFGRANSEKIRRMSQ